MADTMLRWVALALSWITDETELVRRHWRCYRTGHWMSRSGQPQGPTCGQCGTFWPWRD